MLMQRLFFIAPSLARLIRQERGGEHVIEGYFPDQPQRSTFVRIEETGSSLILEADADGAAEEPVALPLAHAQALLTVSQGQVEYVRTRLFSGALEIQALHFVRPSALDVAVVARAPAGSQDHPPLAWLGPEVSTETAYQRRRLALDEASEAPEVEVTDAVLNSLLDLLEDRPTTWLRPNEAARSGAPAAARTPSPVTSAPVPEIEPDDEIGELGIEDEVIRELARSLQPRQRG